MSTPTRPSLWTDRPDDWREAQDDEPTARHRVAGPPPRGPRRTRRALAVALSALALTGVGGGAYLVGNGHDGDGGGSSQPAVAALPAAKGTLAPTPVGKIYAAASKGVVSIKAGNGSGTGFVIDRDGTIVTNAHVVAQNDRVQVRFDDGDAAVEGTVVGSDPSSDLAVVHVDPARTGALYPLTLAESEDVKVGDAAIAIGFPLGLDKTATAGIISGLKREIESPNGFRIDEVLQTDAPINPGNSGGPLLDAKGRVIGVNSQIATAGGGGGNVGIGFSIPSDSVREIVPKLKAGQTIERPWLGVSTGEVTSGGGATIGSVTSGGPAEDAGLQEGDVITKIGDTSIAGSDAVANAVSGHKPGDRVAVTVRRDGSEETVQVTLGTRPGTAP